MIIAHMKENYSFLYLILNMVTWLNSLTSSNNLLIPLDFLWQWSDPLLFPVNTLQTKEARTWTGSVSEHTCFLPLRARESRLRGRPRTPARWTHLTAEPWPGGGSRPARSPRPNQSRRGPARRAGKDQSAAPLLPRPLPDAGGKVSSRPLENFPGKMAQR